jgi:catechol 2,3-dioxygenase-like lactoylglutathione lyase family enzyme
MSAVKNGICCSNHKTTKMKTNSIQKHKLLLLAATTFTAILLSINATTAKAQAPGIVGIDHVGINVPQLDEGIKFFHDMFGFNPVTKLGPVPMDANWKKSFHIHDKASEVTIVMMRAGDGSNIELFGYNPASGSNAQPFRDDLSATHISLYTSDIKATKAYLESKGVKFLSDIIPGGGDTAGESWVYFETPWGATMELNSYPQGKGYEKRNPAVRLWTASSEVALHTSKLTKGDLQALAAKHFSIWNDLNTVNRLKAISVLYTDNVSFFDADAYFNGPKVLNHFITDLQQKNPGFKFSLSRIDNNNNMVRLFWNFGPVANPKLISGMDLIILENGKIRSLSAFLDHAPSPRK